MTSETTVHEPGVAAAAGGGEPSRASSNGAALTLSDVRKTYGSAVAVEGVSLDVRPGEFVTLLGPSGSGKTTTLNMVAGFVELDEGEVLLDGTSIARLPPHKRNIGMVFQNYALFPHMTARENLAYPLRRRRMPKAEIARRVTQALELVHMEAYGDRHPRQLSGGQQQRIAVARAIVFDPRVLLMDEPLGALDKKLREALQVEIKRIHRELGITFIYVTHDQDEALGMSDRIAIFNEGRIAQIGSAEDLYERPASVFVADFVGESNLFEGTCVEERGAACLRCGDLLLSVARRGAWRAGAAATAVVRPEHVLVTPADAQAPADGWNAATGVVEDVTYLGSARKYRVCLDVGGRRVLARPVKGQAVASGSVGDRVTVSWPADASIVLA
ncbi:MAG TPA: ABC transporter ATP-binding protein [Conexibacter sp.]|nr:ABC transporter ATP-binding protein [Conexibacter sp.]